MKNKIILLIIISILLLVSCINANHYPRVISDKSSIKTVMINDSLLYIEKKSDIGLNKLVEIINVKYLDEYRKKVEI